MRSKKQKKFILFPTPRSALRISVILSTCLLLLWSSGCATVPKRPIAEGRLIQIDGISYLPVAAVAKLYDMEFAWDPTTRRAELTSNTARVRLRPDSAIVMVNGQTEVLDHPVLWHKGELVAPAELTKRLVSPFPAVPRIPEIPTYRIQRVIVDAGHGGGDPGAIGRSGLKEKTVNLDIARRLKDELEANGIEVVMTRKDDTFISLHHRTYIANNANADFFVSIHANASSSRKIDGFEVYHLRHGAASFAQVLDPPPDIPVPRESLEAGNSKDLRAALWDLLHAEHRVESVELARTVAWAMTRRLPTPNRGIKGARFYVLRGVRMPAVLVEVGFLTNGEEEERLRNREYRQSVAEAIAAGILTYKSEYERTNGFTN